MMYANFFRFYIANKNCFSTLLWHKFSVFSKTVPLGILLTAFILAGTKLSGTEYHVGPNQTYAELGEVPWIDLTAGDSVVIHWRSTPYASKVYLRAQGTAEEPVVIRGVPNANGDLPVLTGENATTDPQFYGWFDSLWTEALALFYIQRGPYDDYYTYKPKHITFEYLEITGVKPENNFTDQFGNIRNWDDFGTAIAGWVCENLTVRHCKIYDNAQGIFTNTNGDEEGQISRDLLIEYNEIWDNGNADESGRHHNIYSQSAGTIIQYNFLGSVRPGSVGATVKDRSSGTIIRYNWIESSARTLDLVESEDGWIILSQEPNYDDVYVYGNIFTNYVWSDNFSSNMIHFGFDNSPDQAKRGTLYFYNNTIYIEGDETDWWNTRVFDVTDDDDPTTTEGTVKMYNNIIQKSGTTHLQMMRDGGTLEYHANNWLVEDYENLGYGAQASIVYFTDPILGTDPGFRDPANEDFNLLSSSICIDTAGVLPQHIQTDYPVNKQYVKHAAVEERVTIGNAMELGAYEFELALPVKLVQFDVFLTQQQDKILLKWATASETNNKGFEVQKQKHNSQWETIAWVEAKNDLSNLKHYQYTDNKPHQGINYYRLKQIDFDGSSEYSKVVGLDFSHEKIIISYPNPARDQLFIRNPPENRLSYTIYNSSGQIVAGAFLGKDNTINISALSTGSYSLKLQNKNQVVRSMRFVKY